MVRFSGAKRRDTKVKRLGGSVVKQKHWELAYLRCSLCVIISKTYAVWRFGDWRHLTKRHLILVITVKKNWLIVLSDSFPDFHKNYWRLWVLESVSVGRKLPNQVTFFTCWLELLIETDWCFQLNKTIFQLRLLKYARTNYLKYQDRIATKVWTAL